MGEPKGQEGGRHDTSGDAALIPQAAAAHPQKEETPNVESRDGTQAAQVVGDMPQTYWKRLLEEKPDRHIELLLTFAITFFAAVQWITLHNNNSPLLYRPTYYRGKHQRLFCAENCRCF